MKTIYFLFLSVLLTAMTGCQKDEYDGLFNIDPLAENAVTFPDANENGFILMDDNAFIINQNSIANGRVDVRIKSANSKQITSVAPKVQRFRGAIAAPNISPSVPTGAANVGFLAPTTFNRGIVSNLPAATFGGESEVTYSIDLAALPANLTNATLGSVTAPGGSPVRYDTFRFYFLVTYSDGSSILSNEVRVVVRG